MADIRINDIFQELIEENMKITECLNVLIRFKIFVDMISNKLKNSWESNVLEMFEDLHNEVEEVFSKNKKGFSVHIKQTKLQLIEWLSSKTQTTNENNLHLSSDQSIDLMKEKSNGYKPQLLSKKKSLSFTQKKKTKDIVMNKSQSFICDFIGCDKSLTSLQSLKTHQKFHSTVTRRHNCLFEGCLFSTDKRNELTAHINSHKGIKPFICDSCERRFTSKKLMRKHVKSIHEIADQILICGLENCQKEFTTELSMKIHQKYCHLTEKRFLCEEPDCAYKALNRHILKQHIMRVHSEERPIICGFRGCTMTWKCISDMRNHMRSHTSERRFKCTFDDCNKTYKTAQHLKHHALAHSDFQLNCDWPGCEYTTKDRTRLRLHQTRHSTDRNFVCEWPQCEKRFKTRQLLDTHQRIHKNDKRYACSWPGCQYRCTNTGNLVKHKRVHIKK